MRHHNYEALCLLDMRSRKKYLRDLEESLSGTFRVIDFGTKAGRMPSFEHQPSGLEFRLVPEGTFTMGFSESEERAARLIDDPPPLTMEEMRPAVVRTVSSFLVSTRALLVRDVARVFGESYFLNGETLHACERDAPAYLGREAALSVADNLGCRLPYEAEWEYACRAGSQTLFVWGDRLLPDKDLAPWLDLEHPGGTHQNAFGLGSLFTGDWCLDEWAGSHVADAPRTPNVFVVKGGASLFWPWQGSGEWVWCVPANRMPSTALFDDRTCAFRLVHELPPLE